MKKKLLLTLVLSVGVLVVLGVAALTSKRGHSPVTTPIVTKPAMTAVVVQGAATATAVQKPSAMASIASAQAAQIPTAEATQAFSLLLSPESQAHSIIYKVQARDTLTSIARKHNTTVDLLKKINKLPNDKLMLDKKLKIPVYKFSVVVDKSQNTLVLKGDEELLKTYVVATGTNNSTPTGVFKITTKLVDPTWYKEGAVVPSGSPANELGNRWLGINKQGYGIHGTIHPEALGAQVTAGCVRMKNEDVEELFGFMPVGAEVTIVD